MTPRSRNTAYYEDKKALLTRIFGADVEIGPDAIYVGERAYPVVDDVIIALSADRAPVALRDAIRGSGEFAADVQSSFGDQWQRFAEVTDDHHREFAQYFDLIQLDELRGSVVADLGCGSGRYAACAAPYVQELVLVDFSAAIFVARRNLHSAPNAVFLMADVLDLPFTEDAFDFAYSLGVLHHLPVPALVALRRLRPMSRRFLVYLYYALDNRPWYFRLILALADSVRRRTSGVRSARARDLVVWLITLGVYWPLSRLGCLLSPFGLDRGVPLAEFYRGKPVRRLRQDAHDRFLTTIEQRFTRDEIEGFADAEWQIKVSDGLPYWHFVCERRAAPERRAAASVDSGAGA